MISTFFTCSTRANFWLMRSTCASIDALTSAFPASAAGSRQLVLAGVLRRLLRIEGDERDQKRPAVADHHALGHERVLLDLRLEVRGG